MTTVTAPPIPTLPPAPVREHQRLTSGRLPKWAPWAMLGASAHISAPALKTTRMIVRTRALPKRSPSRPASGVQTAALSRKPVSTQVAALAVVSYSSATCGIAGATIVCRSANASAASSSAPSTGAAGFP